MVNFNVRFEIQSTSFEVKFNNVINHISNSVEHYDGDYEVTPKVISQAIPTAEKYLKQDMLVKSIPYFEVTNIAGGNTVYIGSEV